jgi:glycosyltransferase involved in cell wall biosynthesis
VKILYISQYFPPEIAAPAVRVSELASHWTKAGHEVTVLTGFPNHPTGVVPPEYRGKLRRLVVKELVDGVKVVRTWLWPRPNRKALGRMLSFGSFSVSAAISGLFLPSSEVVIATSPQLLVGLTGWWLARGKRVPFVLEVRDLWPESLAAVGMGDEKSLLYRVLGWIAGFLYRECDQIVVVTPAFKEHLEKNWKIAPGKIAVIPNGVETGLFAPGPPNPKLRRDLGAEGKFLVCYIGTMGMAHGLEALLRAAERLQQRAPQVLLVLIGEGAEREQLVAQASVLGLSNLRLVGPQPRERIPDYIRTADACLVLLKNTPVFETVIPTKMLEFMSCARPVVLGVKGQAKKIVDEARAGLCIEPEDSEELSQAVMRLANDPAYGESLGKNGRQHILRNFSRKNTAEGYSQLLRRLLQE